MGKYWEQILLLMSENLFWLIYNTGSCLVHACPWNVTEVCNKGKKKGLGLSTASYFFKQIMWDSNNKQGNASL